MTNPRSSNLSGRHWINLTWPEVPALSAARVGAEGYQLDAPNGAQTETGPGGQRWEARQLAEERTP